MKLLKYDNKLVCINNEYEGYATYNHNEYNFHEYGRDEESIEISHIMFYKSDIDSIKIIKDFSGPYSKIEELISEDEDMVEQALEEDEDEIQKSRLLDFIEKMKN